jgi:hypothetical protein
MLHTTLIFTARNQIFHILLTYQFSHGSKMKVSHLEAFHWAEGESLSFHTLHDIAVETTHATSYSYNYSYIRSRNIDIITTGNEWSKHPDIQANSPNGIRLLHSRRLNRAHLWVRLSISYA